MSKIDDEHIAIEECFALLRQGADQGQRDCESRAGSPNRGSPSDAANAKRAPALWLRSLALALVNSNLLVTSRQPRIPPISGIANPWQIHDPHIQISIIPARYCSMPSETSALCIAKDCKRT